MSESKGQGENVAPERSSGRKHRERTKPPGWEPWALAPAGMKKKYAKRLEKCHRCMPTAIELTCVECQGYSAAEAGRCDAHYCPLFPFNRRIFKVKDKP